MVKENFLIYLISILLVFQPPLGSVPSTWSKYESSINYEKNIFHCFDGKNIIPLNKLNDDFVDCPDGSDEPGTSSFPNGTFFCENKGYFPQYIPKWSVGDGICDCCDGSDEKFNSHSKCQNTCEKVQNERNSLYNILLTGFIAGLKIKEQRNIKGKLKLDESINKKIKFEKQLFELEEAKKRVELTRPIYTPIPEITPINPNIEIENKNELPKENIDHEIERIKDEIARLADEEMEGNTEEYLKDELRHLKEKLQELEKKKQEEHFINEEEQEQEEFNEQSYEEFKEENNKEIKEENNKEIKEENNIEIKEENNIEIKEEHHKEDEIDDEPQWKIIFKLIWKFTFKVPQIRSSLEDNVRQKTLDSINEQINNIRDELRKIEDITNLDKNIDPSSIPLLKESFKNNGFELEFNKEIKQGYSSLGNFKKQENDLMIFEGGAYCWQTQCGKKTNIQTICWKEDKLVNILEVSTCVYKGLFATPNACSKEKIDSLKNKTLEELLIISKSIGL